VLASPLVDAATMWWGPNGSGGSQAVAGEGVDRRCLSVTA